MKLTSKEEKELTSFIKDWLRMHGYSQKDLAFELNITSSRTSEILKKVKEFHKKGGYFNVAKKLIEIEQNWINKSLESGNLDKQLTSSKTSYPKEKESHSYSQLDLNYKVDIDLLMDKMAKDFKE
tara:strand:- start:605 stop:979 length:375 start_codon:yes stop_codon:yes gene_type:complete